MGGVAFTAAHHGMTAILGAAVLLWQLATGPAPSVGISTTGIIERLPDTATSVSGKASWYCGGGSRCTRGYPGGLYAAAGPALRTGDWRGRRVTVCSSGRCVKVKLIDFCACPSRVIDLYRDAFARLAAPSRGVIRVSVSWGDSGPASTLPPTNTGG